MPATFELRSEPSVHYGQSFLFGNLALTEGNHIAVTVLLGKTCGPFVPDHSTSNPTKPIGNDCFITASADKNAESMPT